MEIRDARSLPSIAQEDLHKKAIKAVMEGKKQVEVAAILGVTVSSTVDRAQIWHAIFRLDSGEVFGSLGFYPAKASAARL